MNKQDYELFADCRIKIYDENWEEYDIYAEIENLGASTPKKPLKVRFFKPTTNGLVYLDDASTKTMHPNWINEPADYFQLENYLVKHDNKHYTGLVNLWVNVMMNEEVEVLSPKHVFELESICHAIESCEFLGYNEKHNWFTYPEHCPKIKKLVAFQHEMNAQLAHSAKQQQNKKAEPEMER